MAQTRKIVAVVLLLGVALAWFTVRDQLTLERAVESERRLRLSIDAQPWRAFTVGFAVYVVVSLFPGTTGKSVVAGWLFGFWPALVMVVGALTVAGGIAFTLARYLFFDTLHSFLGPRVARLDRAIEHEGVFYLLTLRLLHFPFTLVNYLSGISAVRWQTFIWTTAVGLIPGTVVLAGLGAGLPSLDELLEHGVISLISPGVLLALLAMGLVPLLVRSLVRAWRPA